MKGLTIIAKTQPILVQLVNESRINIGSVLSVLAIVVSIIAIIMQWYNSWKSRKINLEAEYFSKIYQEYLVEKVPKARLMICYNNCILGGVDELIQVLNDMRRDSLFFKYQDAKFYQNICKELQKLEDKLVKKSGKMSDEEYVMFVTELNGDIEMIYDIINRRYLGQKAKKMLSVGK